MLVTDRNSRFSQPKEISAAIEPFCQDCNLAEFVGTVWGRWSKAEPFPIVLRRASWVIDRKRIAIQEGGYHLPTLGELVVATLAGLESR